MARFYDRHTGILGPGVPLPEAAAEVAQRYEDTEAEPAEVVAALRAALPDAEVKDSPPGGVTVLPDGKPFGEPRAFGMITLRVPAQGYPAHCWRVLKYAAD